MSAPQFENTQFIVICRGDREGPRKPGNYLLTTRRVFASWLDATAYSKTIAKSRQPLVVEGRFTQLRFTEKA